MRKTALFSSDTFVVLFHQNGSGKANYAVSVRKDLNDVNPPADFLVEVRFRERRISAISGSGEPMMTILAAFDERESVTWSSRLFENG